MDIIKIDLQIAMEDYRWQEVMECPIDSFLEKYISAVLRHEEILPTIPKHTEVSIVLTNNSEIQMLNRKYRGKDKPTNILSFPQEANLSLTKDAGTCVLIGDIVLSIETIQQEAIQQQKLIDHHLAHLIVHGTLHLLGYDHETEEEADIMESLEIDILRRNNIPNPYESERTYVV